MGDGFFEGRWGTVAVLVGRLIFAGVFGMALAFKIMDPGGTAAYIAGAGFPFSGLLTWLAMILEGALVLVFLTGAFFRPGCLIAAAYVVFLAIAFHGPSHWTESEAEFGFFVDHFTFLAGLLFAAAHGPDRLLVVRAADRTGEASG